jgi:hypothetical protein
LVRTANVGFGVASDVKLALRERSWRRGAARGRPDVHILVETAVNAFVDEEHLGNDERDKKQEEAETHRWGLRGQSDAVGALER